jgi:hypothetical protein
VALYFVGADLRYRCLFHPNIRLGMAVLDRCGDLPTDNDCRRRSALRGAKPDGNFKLTHYLTAVAFNLTGRTHRSRGFFAFYSVMKVNDALPIGRWVQPSFVQFLALVRVTDYAPDKFTLAD